MLTHKICHSYKSARGRGRAHVPRPTALCCPAAPLLRSTFAPLRPCFGRLGAFSNVLPRSGVVLGSFWGPFLFDLAVDGPLRRKKADPHETLRLCSETGLGPPANDPEFDRKSLREPPAKRSAKRSLEKVVPRPPKGVLGSIREPSGRSGSASGGPGRAPKPLWTPPGSAPDRPWSPRSAPGPPPSDFGSILRRSWLDLGSMFARFLFRFVVVPSFVRSFVRPFVCSFVCFFVRLFVCSSAFCLLRSAIRSFVRSFLPLRSFVLVRTYL